MDSDWDDVEDVDDTDYTFPCPECGAEVYEEAVQCPKCGSYITFDTSPWAGKPTWWVAMGIVGIIAVIIALALA